MSWKTKRSAGFNKQSLLSSDVSRWASNSAAVYLIDINEIELVSQISEYRSFDFGDLYVSTSSEIYQITNLRRFYLIYFQLMCHSCGNQLIELRLVSVRVCYIGGKWFKLRIDQNYFYVTSLPNSAMLCDYCVRNSLPTKIVSFILHHFRTMNACFIWRTI